jgi:uncharacterized membrane protein
MRIPAGDRFIGFLGYLPLLCLVIAKFVKRDSMFVQFHARQGSVLFVMWLSAILVLAIALLFAGAGLAATILIGIVFLVTFLYAFMMLAGMVKVLLGERYRMPVVADVALKLGL